MKTVFVGILAVSLAAGTLEAEAQSRRSSRRAAVALIYNGPGSCEDETLEDPKPEIRDCSAAAATVARKAGLIPKFVGPDAVDGQSTPEQINALFESGRVWIQPGGNSGEAFDSMSDELLRGLTTFVRSGGGYVGFCAGAFMATELIGKKGNPGLGIFPGRSVLYPHGAERPDLDYILEPILWKGVKRKVFLEGGPYLILPESSKVEVIATYGSGAVATARTKYGKGRVYITGLHPEAPLRWTQEDGLVDPDGIEQDLAAEMVRWAASSSAVKMPAPRKSKKPRVARD